MCDEDYYDIPDGDYYYLMGEKYIRMSEKRKNELEEEIADEEKRRKNELRRIVKNANLDNITETDLITKINQNKIITEIELKEEIQQVEDIDKIRKEKRNELKRIVKDANLDYVTETNLLYKINHNQITNEYDIKEEINKEIRKKEEERERKSKLIGIVDDSELDSAIKSDLIIRINNNRIITEKELIGIVDEKIKSKLIRFAESAKIDSTIKSDLLYKINQNKIRTKKELKEEMKKEESKNKLRKIVRNKNISPLLKEILYEKIQNYEINDEDDYKKVLSIIKIREELIEQIEKSELQFNKKEVIKKIIMNDNIIDQNRFMEELKKDIYIEKRKVKTNSKANNWNKTNKRRKSQIVQIAEDICYIEDFDGWYFDNDGISFYRKSTGLYNSKFEHYTFDELRQHR